VDTLAFLDALIVSDNGPLCQPPPKKRPKLRHLQIMRSQWSWQRGITQPYLQLILRNFREILKIRQPKKASLRPFLVHLKNQEISLADKEKMSNLYQNGILPYYFLCMLDGFHLKYSRTIFVTPYYWEIYAQSAEIPLYF